MGRNVALNEYNRLFSDGKLNWHEFDASELPDSTREYVQQWVLFCKCHAMLHRPVLANQYLFRLDGVPGVRFLICDADEASHMWGDESFENVDNDRALAKLACAKGGTEELWYNLFTAVTKQQSG